MTTVMLDETPATKDEATLTLTLRGDVSQITHALIHGFPLSALQQLADAFSAELAKRAEECRALPTAQKLQE